MGSVGRNEPCPCGSGRKYKKCHGAPVNAADPVAVLPGDAPGLFGPRAGYLISLLDSFGKAAQPRSYRIMPLAESATRPPNDSIPKNFYVAVCGLKP
jgi:hypothetical protein